MPDLYCYNIPSKLRSYRIILGWRSALIREVYRGTSIFVFWLCDQGQVSTVPEVIFQSNMSCVELKLNFVGVFGNMTN